MATVGALRSAAFAVVPMNWRSVASSNASSAQVEEAGRQALPIFSNLVTVGMEYLISKN